MKASLVVWADAIQEFEGWYPNSRSFRNNNPGNLRYVGQKLAIGKDDAGFCIFKTAVDGYNTLIAMLESACTGGSEIYSPAMTLRQFFDKYAPSSDSNDPDRYSEFVAKKIGCDMRDTIANIYKGSIVDSNADLDSNKLNDLLSDLKDLVEKYT